MFQTKCGEDLDLDEAKWLITKAKLWRVRGCVVGKLRVDTELVLNWDEGENRIGNFMSNAIGAGCV
jgi:hypothetical protein